MGLTVFLDCVMLIFIHSNNFTQISHIVRTQISHVLIVMIITYFLRMYPPMIAVGSDDSNPATGGKVFIYEYNENSRRWTKLETINITEPVHDLSFSPNLGRHYHVLAVASKDVRIINLNPIE